MLIGPPDYYVRESGSRSKAKTWFGNWRASRASPRELTSKIDCHNFRRGPGNHREGHRRVSKRDARLPYDRGVRVFACGRRSASRNVSPPSVLPRLLAAGSASAAGALSHIKLYLCGGEAIGLVHQSLSCRSSARPSAATTRAGAIVRAYSHAVPLTRLPSATPPLHEPLEGAFLIARVLCPFSGDRGLGEAFGLAAELFQVGDRRSKCGRGFRRR